MTLGTFQQDSHLPETNNYYLTSAYLACVSPYSYTVICNRKPCVHGSEVGDCNKEVFRSSLTSLTSNISPFMSSTVTWGRSYIFLDFLKQASFKRQLRLKVSTAHMPTIESGSASEIFKETLTVVSCCPHFLYVKSNTTNKVKDNSIAPHALFNYSMKQARLLSFLSHFLQHQNGPLHLLLPNFIPTFCLPIKIKSVFIV